MIKFIIVCTQDDLILSTNLLYSGCTGMCDLNGRRRSTIKHLFLAFIKVCLDPTSQTRDLTSTFTFHVARCDKIHNSWYTGHHIHVLSTNLLYSGCTGMCDLNGRRRSTIKQLFSAFIKVHVAVYVTIKSETFAGNLIRNPIR